MTPSEELELKIFQFAESVGNSKWRQAGLRTLSPAVEYLGDGDLVNALIDLCVRGFLEFRQFRNAHNAFVYFSRDERVDFFYRHFEMCITDSGRNYFETLEIQSGELRRHKVPSQSAAPQSAGDKPSCPRAFVSHATQDHTFVEKFATDLRAHGIAAWFSKWEIKPGDSIPSKIDEGLEDCEYFIIVLSKNSIGRPWVQTELDAATIRKLSGKVQKIIPVKIEDCGDLPPTLASLCWEDFSNQPYEAALRRVLDSIFEVDVRPPLGKQPTYRAPQAGVDDRRSEQHRDTAPGKSVFPINIFDVQDFAKRLEGEGFDARTDLLNGQVGLIIGPKGLDPKRMPPDTMTLFFPLWELNHESNRPLVDARGFHDIFASRPKGWAFNRPYQKDRTPLNRPEQREVGSTVQIAKRRYIVEREFKAWRPANRDSSDKHLTMRPGFHIFSVIEASDRFEAAPGFTGKQFTKFDMDAIEYETDRRTLFDSVRLCSPEEIPPSPFSR